MACGFPGSMMRHRAVRPLWPEELPYSFPMNSPQTLSGIRVGHASDLQGLTGCTVVVAERGAVCGADVRGSAAGTREIVACLPDHLVDRAHAVFLTGGSAFGLDAARGVTQFLESKGVGFPAGCVNVPIVPSAVIFDLNLGSAASRPTSTMALEACRQASRSVREGSVGAGTGATVGKLFGIDRATKGGQGFSSLRLSGGVSVQALAVVNSFGDVVDPRTGRILAGARRSPRASGFVDTCRQMLAGRSRKNFGGTNTTLAVVLTDARLSKLQAVKVAQIAHDGMARAVRPVHTRFDGDIVFVLSTGRRRADLDAIGVAAAEALARAIVRGVKLARGQGGVPAYRDLRARP